MRPSRHQHRSTPGTQAQGGGGHHPAAQTGSRGREERGLGPQPPLCPGTACGLQGGARIYSESHGPPGGCRQE